MYKKVIMGNEAIALGAIKAGVNLVSGYPGTPSTEVLESIAENNPGHIYVEWSVNEKVALEVAAGAAYAGARSLVTMKQVGLNVASDPLMSLSYIGIKGGMVVLVADDPGPFSSQTEQDTRHFARFSNLPVFDPSSPEEAFEMIQAAFQHSEQVGLPVFFRPTTRICHSCSTLEIPELGERHKADGFVKDPRWVIFPSLSYRKHVQLEETQKKISDIFSNLKYNKITGQGNKGIAASGIAYAYIKDVLSSFNKDIKLMKIGTPYPFPQKLGMDFIDGLDEILVFEELDPVIEESLLELKASNGYKISVLGKKTGHLPYAGEYSYELVKTAVAKFIGIDADEVKPLSPPELPVRPPVLCAGCPHRASFYAVKTALKNQKAVFSGDIGCYTLGNAKPLDMVDTCLCMGAGITIAQGLQRVEPDVKHIAFIGDSTFFHTGIPGIINAVYNNTDITVVILDNSTTAMTGNQPHPGTGKTMMRSISEKVDIYGMVKACGVKKITKANPLNQKEAIDAVKENVSYNGPSVVIFEAPCIALQKQSNIQAVNEKCTLCKKCIREAGCPGMSIIDGKVVIEKSLCYGCTLCSQICPVGAIGGANK
ncbi:indolepyruvate ferredoxin oxidoreductase subunit alpha [Pseudobacteroides cellulosolvens]|uniref:Indolepyruvate oxidoreductase subunit IorA n=1 Tax=Pseudobacteroides cellulosolvens ATCC 35603 = DSM 2933 TaxID=398512 RepID=A0A0L6JIB1_9FIRM|nr:indolepyruvate ferredoxin oxidoreductase subunit alpha [Pseudobacteroides cellulosolvens]KNY25596.1 indolepyruvate ferredoxin oxidoreductase, alpha subunit [Pseudobacteroides cellulosolvens ATCC 35603 = DSM 2933]